MHDTNTNKTDYLIVLGIYFITITATFFVLINN